MIVEIQRVYLPTEVLGSFYIDGALACKTLELAWRDNKRSVSCIPEGTYKVKKEPPKEGRPYPYFRLMNVPGRSGILIHRGVFTHHSKGCILVGTAFTDWNKDNVPDLADSTNALNKLIELLPNEFDLVIKKKP
jgi:hypothetical protein